MANDAQTPGRPRNTEGRPRNTEKTRQLVLATTRQLLIEQGTGISLALVAERAGISKSGLMHHFPSRDELFRAVLDDTHAQFRADVMARLDLSENSPGKVLRAYVRALCSPDSEAVAALSTTSFWSGIEGLEGADELSKQDVRRWDAELSADGLDPDLIRIVQRAAEGLATAFAYGDETAESLERAGAQLVAMTRRTPPWSS